MDNCWGKKNENYDSFNQVWGGGQDQIFFPSTLALGGLSAQWNFSRLGIFSTLARAIKRYQEALKGSFLGWWHPYQIKTSQGSL